MFLQDLEEDAEFRAHVNLYKADMAEAGEETKEHKHEESKVDKKDEEDDSWEDIEEDVPEINQSEI